MENKRKKEDETPLKKPAAAKVLIADDDESILWVLGRFFEEKGMPVVKAANGAEAEKLLTGEGAFQLALLDINMPLVDGLSVLRRMKTSGSPAEVIIMTAESSMENTIEAMKLGAFDYIIKPFDLNELEIAVERVFDNIRLKAKLSNLKEILKEKFTQENAFVGKSRSVQNVFKTVGRISSRDVTVLILGESGTGKEMLARIMHSSSVRSDGPFVAVNTAAVPRDLIESELFGFEKGAFTGAVEAKKGKFELADGGTIFLDEIGDMPLDMQSRLLRVMQGREFFRLGGKEVVRVDVRIIAATNQDLEKAVEEKRFREDLLFRLNGVTVTLPPLRERKGDVAILADYFLEKFCREFGGGKKIISAKALEGMEAYDWPGNVRQMENAIRRAVILSTGINITLDDIALPLSRHKRESLEDIITVKLKPFIEKTGNKGRQELYAFLMPFMERPIIKLVLEKTGGNQLQAAEVLGINRNTLRKKIKDLKINVDKIKE